MCETRVQYMAPHFTYGILFTKTIAAVVGNMKICMIFEYINREENAVCGIIIID